ncbi:MAG TPA: macro domain-containing protein [Pyrinomonadaceae bacterium]|nr:macro domain-containing protein [Pyrinomonadaceae bacterium]
MFKALIGDLFKSDAQTLVNTVNCVGIMGKGVAQEFKNRYPAMFADYVTRCNRKLVRLGEPYPYYDKSGRVIINFPTKDHWRSPSRLIDIERGLDYFRAHYQEWGVTSLACPPLGCGNGGLEWTEVGPLIFRKLHHLKIDIEVYAPYGTPKPQLTEEFFDRPAQLELTANKREKLNPEWVLLVEVLREMQQQPYAIPVGRTIFQKICYVLTDMGVKTGFHFSKGSYGPFAGDVKQALHEFANRNWLQEQPLGRMIAMRVTEQYEKDRVKYRETIQRNETIIERVVDLFSRLKSTEQAEEVMTVLFAAQQLKQAYPNQEIGERQLYDYILGWKKNWRGDAKRRALASAIRNLVILGWMRLSFSESLSEAT